MSGHPHGVGPQAHSGETVGKKAAACRPGRGLFTSSRQHSRLPIRRELTPSAVSACCCCCCSEEEKEEKEYEKEEKPEEEEEYEKKEDT